MFLLPCWINGVYSVFHAGPFSLCGGGQTGLRGWYKRGEAPTDLADFAWLFPLRRTEELTPSSWRARVPIETLHQPFGGQSLLVSIWRWPLEIQVPVLFPSPVVYQCDSPRYVRHIWDILILSYYHMHL